MNSKELAEKIATIGWEKKGNDIVLLDVRQLTDITDFFVIMSGESEPHVKALSDYVEEKLGSNGEKVWHREGYQNLNWDAAIPGPRACACRMRATPPALG